MVKKASSLTLIILGITSFCLIAGHVDAQQPFPSKPIQLVAASNPGGSADLCARMIEQTMIAEKLIDKPFTILNKGGAAGNAMTTHLMEQRGNGHAIGLNTNRVIINHLMGTFQYGFRDITPVVRLVCDNNVWAVRAESKYKTAMEVMADLKKDPASVVFGLGTPYSGAHFAVLVPAKLSGVDYTKIKVAALPAEYVVQLLGGHIPIIVTSLSEIIPHVDAGKMRLLSIASASRHARLKDVPTWRDLGIDYVAPHWRAAWGAPDMPKVAYDYWNKKFAQMVKTKTWKELLVKNELDDSFLPGEELRKELEKEEVTVTEVLRGIGKKK